MMIKFKLLHNLSVFKEEPELFLSLIPPTLFIIGCGILTITSIDPGEDLSSQLPIALLNGALFIIYLLCSLLIVQKKSYLSYSGHHVEAILKRKARLKLLKMINKIIFFLFLAMALIIILYLADMVYYSVTFDYGNLPKEQIEKDKHGLLQMSGDIAMSAAIYLFIAAYIVLFFVPSLPCLSIALLVAVKWRNPAKFLLLRAFNDGSIAKSLKRVMRNQIGFIGHTYSLADVEIKTPWYVKLPLFIGQLGFLNFRLLVIKKQKHVDRMVAVIQNRWLRNINWCMSWNNIFPIRTVDEFWRQCVNNLVLFMDGIFVDLSEIRPNILWEVQECTKLGVGERIIFLVREDVYEQVATYISQFSNENGFKQKLLKYTVTGKIDKNEFESILSSLPST